MFHNPRGAVPLDRAGRPRPAQPQTSDSVVYLLQQGPGRHHDRGFPLQVRLKRPTRYAVLALEMFNVLIYCSASQRHQVWIRYSRDLRNQVASLYDNDLEPGRIEAEYGEIVDLVEWPPQIGRAHV